MKEHLESAIRRMRGDRRKIDRPSLSPFEIHCARLCRDIPGVTFVGIQRIENFPAQAILINHYKSSFCVPVVDFSVGRILVESQRSKRPWVEAEDRRFAEVQS